MSSSDFNHPQRQSLIGVLVMFADTLRKIVRALWPLLVVWLFKFNEMNKLYLGLGVIVVVSVVGIIAYLQYLNFTFHIDEENDEFIIHEGVLNKSKIAIQLHKIQQVNISQSFVQKIIGVHALDIDTAGSTKKEVSIRAISHDLAVALRTKLLSEVSSVSEVTTLLESVNEETEKPFIAISFLSLVKIGITSNYVRSFGLLTAFFFTVYENVQNVARNSHALDQMDAEIESYINRNMALYSATILIGIVFFAILVINLFRTIIKYFDFKITKKSRSLLLSYGLLSTKNTIIKPNKVQIVALSQNWLQKKMDVLSLKIKQASGSETEKENRKSAIEIPGCDEVEREAILKLLFGQIPEKGVMLKPNIRKLLFPSFFLIILPVSIVFGYGFIIDNKVFDYILILPFYLAFVGLLLYFGFRNYRLFINQQYIIRQSGAWDVDNEIIEPHKIQAIKVSQFFWHKRANVGSVTITTAGGDLSFYLGNFSKIKELVNTWLYQVETTKENWM
ncbi:MULTISPECIES: PH domain-containing protein [Flavobacterium]|uniref:PH domain-containing protein n=1 Tax=Flavobacterium TaxID=237 RepID=UPI001FCCA63D|nr:MULTISPECIES: PH domain-containing protein [Flavobacterium]UOK42252.1 PH domain-containing protein [Flavobacterium enshiense]